MGKIGLFPASGNLGTSIYQHLLQYVKPSEVVLVSRHPEKIASQSIDSAVKTRKADFEVASTLEKGFEGVSHLILISKSTVEIDSRVKAHKDAIDAAIRSGVSHIFYASFALHGGDPAQSAAYCMQAHLHTEAYLQSLASDPSTTEKFTFTIIREGFYSESFPMYIGFPNLQDPESRLRVPHDGSGPGIAFAKLDELGESTANLARKYHASGVDGLPELKNEIVLLSGPRAYSLVDIAEILSAALGEKKVIEPVDVEEYVNLPNVQEALRPYGEGDVARKWATSFDALKNGEAATTADVLERLLGRAPEPFEVTIKTMIQGMEDG